MKRFATLLLSLLSLVAALGFPVDAAAADSYPARPVRIIVTYPAGGLSDVMARIAAQMLTDATFGAIVATPDLRALMAVMMREAAAWGGRWVSNPRTTSTSGWISTRARR